MNMTCTWTSRCFEREYLEACGINGVQPELAEPGLIKELQVYPQQLTPRQQRPVKLKWVSNICTIRFLWMVKDLVYGAYNTTYGEIEIITKMNDTKTLEVLLHELQHDKQWEEGYDFDRYHSDESVEQYIEGDADERVRMIIDKIDRYEGDRR